MACHQANDGSSSLQAEYVAGSYGYDLSFLKKHTKGLIELYSADGKSRIALSPQYQGRVFTSTAEGNTGMSFGWLNYNLLSAPAEKRQFTAVGGEERLWFGPEGGQYSIYFQQGDTFLFKNWQVPAVIDTEVYDIENTSLNTVLFSKKAQLQNYNGTSFELLIRRRIILREVAWLEKILQYKVPEGLSAIGYTSENSLTNSGRTEWKTEDGLLSIWLLGMFAPTPETYVIIPFQKGLTSHNLITDDYFGEIPGTRLQKSDSLLIFKCDGKFRSKIGIHPSIAKPLAMAFDFINNVLTIVVPEIHKDKPYVNSKWEIQRYPYEGDAVNAYNDGPLADGSLLGPFFEIESSSPALALKSGESSSYSQSTFHITGSFNELQKIVFSLSGADLRELRKISQQ